MTCGRLYSVNVQRAVDDAVLFQSSRDTGLSRVSDYKLHRHGGRHIQEAGERTRLLCDGRARGET